jgi:zinc D-Ala-D-Ala carboxypeptidase
MTMLSEHFSLAELCRTAQPYPNIAPAPVIARLTLLCVKLLEPVRAHYGRPVTVNSGYRGPAVNRAVGSKPTSQHPKGEAADIEIDGVANADLAAWIRDNLHFDQLILEAYRPGVAGSGWVHVSYREPGLRHQCLTMTMGSHGPVYTNGINP